jgi:hypothetical protein
MLTRATATGSIAATRAAVTSSTGDAARRRRFVTVCRDITELKDRENAIALAKEEVERPAR